MEKCSITKTGRLGKTDMRKIDRDEGISRIAKVGKIELFACYIGREMFVSGYIRDNSGNKGDMVISLTLEEEYGDFERRQFYSVTMVEICRQYSGYGLAPKLYRALMRATGINIISGSIQSRGGQSIWNRMFDTKGVRLMAYRHTERKPRCLRDVTFNEFQEELNADDDLVNIWSDSEYNNWRLVAEYTGA